MQLWVLAHMYQLALKVWGSRGGGQRQECGGVAEAGWGAALGADAHMYQLALQVWGSRGARVGGGKGRNVW